jgi:hypothetical protein
VTVFKFEYDKETPVSLVIVRFDNYLRTVVLPKLDPNTSELQRVCIAVYIPKREYAPGVFSPVDYTPGVRVGTRYLDGAFKVAAITLSEPSNPTRYAVRRVMKITFATEYCLQGLM